ncbi:quinon protein alcohol dehydrogenase-like superfamily [Podospora fimiseda]|uniref:Quinon protein alcohol dehydrogenase-like superfamily n=1 Tax=Podospora fimiseda TaxID=252190 RepID=A0AAN7BLD4_9PEZI|nr:quinon protein alcohol dehydrogenase-like superfamily [Podospora fimiseda]
MVLEDGSTYSGLDGMYLKVLEFPGRDLFEEETRDLYSRFRAILGVITSVFEPISEETIRGLLPDLEDKVHGDLTKLLSLLDVPEDDTGEIILLHLSFHDFLHNEGRCGQDFYIDAQSTHDYILGRALDLMTQQLRQDICELKMPSTKISDVKSVENYAPAHLSYSCRYWGKHLATLDDLSQKNSLLDGGRVHAFLKEKFPEWVEALSLVGDIGVAISTVNLLLRMLKITQKPVVQDDWDVELFQIQDIDAKLITFSLDGRVLAIGSWDEGYPEYAIICVLDAMNDRERVRFKLPEYFYEPEGLILSPDGKPLASTRVSWESEESLYMCLSVQDAATGRFITSDSMVLDGPNHDCRSQAIIFKTDNTLIWRCCCWLTEITPRSHSTQPEERDWYSLDADQFDCKGNPCFSPDGKLLITVMVNKPGIALLVRVFSAEDGTFIKSFEIAPNDLQTGHWTEFDLGHLSELHFDVDGGKNHVALAHMVQNPQNTNWIASVGKSGYSMLYDISSNPIKWLPMFQPFPWQVQAFALASTGLLAVVDIVSVQVWGAEIWSHAKPKLVDDMHSYTLKEECDVLSIEFHPGESRFTLSEDSLWTVDKGVIRPNETSMGPTKRICFSPDGAIVALIKPGSVAEFWDGDVAEMKKRFDNVTAVYFSHDSQTVALSSSESCQPTLVVDSTRFLEKTGKLLLHDQYTGISASPSQIKTNRKNVLVSPRGDWVAHVDYESNSQSVVFKHVLNDGAKLLVHHLDSLVRTALFETNESGTTVAIVTVVTTLEQNGFNRLFRLPLAYDYEPAFAIQEGTLVIAPHYGTRAPVIALCLGLNTTPFPDLDITAGKEG